MRLCHFIVSVAVVEWIISSVKAILVKRQLQSSTFLHGSRTENSTYWDVPSRDRSFVFPFRNRPLYHGTGNGRTLHTRPIFPLSWINSEWPKWLRLSSSPNKGWWLYCHVSGCERAGNHARRQRKKDYPKMNVGLREYQALTEMGQVLVTFQEIVRL